MIRNDIISLVLGTILTAVFVVLGARYETIRAICIGFTVIGVLGIVFESIGLYKRLHTTKATVETITDERRAA